MNPSVKKKKCVCVWGGGGGRNKRKRVEQIKYEPTTRETFLYQRSKLFNTSFINRATALIPAAARLIGSYH